MGAADAAAIARGVAGITLMEAAGRAVARAAMRRFRPAPTLVLAGPGNNGGDGYVAARLLEQAGWDVAVAPLGVPPAGSDAAVAAARWRGPRVPFDPARAARAGLVIDAVFGAGLVRDVDGVAAAVLHAVRAPLLAVDVPSGIDGATGQVRGFAPQAALTVTFFRRKPGHLLLPGRSLCGEVICADIGLPAAVLDAIAPRCFANAPGLWHLPAARVEDHKYRRGHVTVAAGATMTGAARLAAGAARRAGAGLVSLMAPDAATAAILRGGEPGAMVTEEAAATLLADARRSVWVVGPGLAPDAATQALGRSVIAAGRVLVADAALLTACVGAPEALVGATVLTPHAREFAYMFGDPLDRLAACRAAAARIGGVVLLKGADTVIAAPDGRAAINENAPPSLATGGSGDVLAGTIAALIARGMAPFEAACAGAWAQGEAARRIGPGLIPEDVIAALPAALQAAGIVQQKVD
ncbi:NAD(P)H-hydrate dehydratase [Roseomonas hellenica]|uniref:Bifunctional NAD(P)H-hydrate repair enzyme n=3 Tax=Plastoroseomonas hellenica TaxID=2687306 RepID=A0ABS5ESW2_9PROT|nr:NAD(P)H-hydrate dehydratase [Plastoroseomonas hellenica]